ncbi:MAG: hypothetical protein GYA57_03225 [Myxococcales bacterium]|nr:hypothetical protein [Myxococcales bacterium]
MGKKISSSAGANSSHTPIEVLVVFAETLGLEHGLDKPLLLRIQKEFFAIFEELGRFIPYAGKFYRPVDFADVDRRKVERILALVQSGRREDLDRALPITREILADLKYPDYDDRIFSSQIPGGMYTNLVNQLKEMGRPEILQQTLEECPRVRADVGYVPLVTPTSQIVGSQAAFNVIFGSRYAFASNEFKMLLRGEFGRTPAPCNPEVVRQVLGEDVRPLAYRAAAYLMPVLEDPCDLPFVRTHKDRLLHHMLGQAADAFLRRKYGVPA